MHPLRSFSKLIQFSLLAETISFSLLHLLIPNGGFLFTPHLLHPACQKSLSSPSSPHFPFDSSFILKVSGREPRQRAAALCTPALTLRGKALHSPPAATNKEKRSFGGPFTLSPRQR